MLETSLKVHIDDHHAQNPMEHLCDLCGRSFNSKYKVVAHERVAHGKRGVFHCDKCDDDKPFQTTLRETLLHHQYSLHGYLPEGAPLYSCEQCEFKTPVKFNINRHVKRSHPVEPFSCSGNAENRRTKNLIGWRHSYLLGCNKRSYQANNKSMNYSVLMGFHNDRLSSQQIAVDCSIVDVTWTLTSRGSIDRERVIHAMNASPFSDLPRDSNIIAGKLIDPATTGLKRTIPIIGWINRSCAATVLTLRDYWEI